jgi:hypothetical protein
MDPCAKPGERKIGAQRPKILHIARKIDKQRSKRWRRDGAQSKNPRAGI